MTTLAVTSVSSLRCQASTCFRIGSKLRCIRSTPTEMQSMSENDFECFASTGVNTPERMSPNSGCREVDFPEADWGITLTCKLLARNCRGEMHFIDERTACSVKMVCDLIGPAEIYRHEGVPV